jgi:hypothetical protein
LGYFLKTSLCFCIIFNSPAILVDFFSLRDGASAELDAYAVRGTLHGAPNLSSQSRILVRIARVEPMRGWLTLDFLGTVA